jgi:glycosyltransferase involved in cell wall biosynthesis
MTTDDNKTGCVIIPGYKEAGRIGPVVSELIAAGHVVIVVDDGSPDATAEEAGKAGATVLRHETNKGKGAALQTGFAHAVNQGFEYVVTMDADGQHAPGDVALFVKAYGITGIPVLVGNRMSDPQGMPFVRRCTNRYMSWLLSRRMGQYVPDTQNGFRLYRCDVLEYVRASTAGFAAESEVLLNLATAGIQIGSVPVRAIYGDEKSKIRPVRDTMRFFAMLRRHDREWQRAIQEGDETC